MSHNGVGLRAVMRSVAFLTAGALAVPALAGCSSEEKTSKPLAEQDIAPAARDQVADGGTLHWAVDAVPETLNTFQADADATTTAVAQAVLPSMYRLDAAGRPQINPDYLESAKVVETEPQQVVLYKLNQQAVWSDGREIGAADFAAQWRALSGKDSAYWTARNAGYERIEKIERGANDLEVRVTFARPYADWRSLFSPLYPKDVMGTPDSFNDSARKKLKVTAGPFRLKKVDRKDGEVTLARSERWWGHPAKLDEIVLRAVPRDERAGALAAGDLDLAEIDPEALGRINLAARAGAKAGSTPLAGPGGLSGHGPGSNLGAAEALRSWAVAHEDDEKAADEESDAREKKRKAALAYERQQTALKGFEVRRSLEPAYTQLALNGASGPLADERVRRAVARALDRKALASAVLTPLGLPAEPVGSHLALSGQDAYADNSGALGGQDTEEAEALLADAGWGRRPPGPRARSRTRTRTTPRTRRTPRTARTSSARTARATTRTPRTTRTGATAPPGTSRGTASSTRTSCGRAARRPGPTPPRAPPPRRARRPRCWPRTARRWHCGSCCRRARAPRPCGPWPAGSPRCSRRSASAPRSPRCPTRATSRTTSRPASTTWRCTPGPPPRSPRPTPGPSSPSRCRPPTDR